MGIFRTGLLAISASTLGPGLPAFAQEAAPTEAPIEEAAETLVIPFDPPVGTALRYALTYENKGGRGPGPVTMEQELKFERIETGFLLNFSNYAMVAGGQRFDLTDPRIMRAMPVGLRPFVIPLTVELDQNGEMIRMRDWDEAKQALRKLPQTLATIEGDDPNSPEVKAVERLLAPLLNTSAENAPGLMIRGWPSVFGYGGIEMEDGVPYAAETATQSDIAAVALQGTAVVSLARQADGSLNYKQSTSFDPESLRQMTGSLVAKVEREGGAGPSDKVKEELASFTMVDELDFVLDGKSGMPISAVVKRVASIGDKDVGGQETIIRRIGK